MRRGRIGRTLWTLVAAHMPRRLAIATAFWTQFALVAVARAAGVVNPCTEASLDAALAGGGVVTFACSGTIQPEHPKVITADTVLDGAGQPVTLDATRIFHNYRLREEGMRPIIDVAAGSRLEVRALTFTGVLNFGSEGAAILNHGTLVVRDSTFSDNLMLNAFRSAAAIVNRGSAEVHSTTFSRNQLEIGRAGDYLAGAIWSDGTLFVGDSTFMENGEASDFLGGGVSSGGGAIFLEGGITTISGSVFAHNEAGVSAGNQGSGAIWARGRAIVSIVDSIFHHNRGYTGAVSFLGSDGVLSVSDCEFEGNIGFTGAVRIGMETRASIEGSEFLENVCDARGAGSLDVPDSAIAIEKTATADVAGNGSRGEPTRDLAIASAIYNAGTTEITGSALRGNLGYGAIVNDGGSIELRQVTIDSTRVGLPLPFPAPVPFDPVYTGAALLNYSGTAVIEESVITNNVALAGSGTILNHGGSMEIRRSELSGNGAAAASAILNAEGSLTLSNSTLFGNVSSTPPVPPGDCHGDPSLCLIPHGLFERGGAIVNRATLNLVNVTIAGNTHATAGGPGPVSGIINAATGVASLRNVILSGDEPSQLACLSEGAFDAVATLIGRATGCPTDSGETSLPEVRLGAPAGSPAFLPLLAGSPAIDRGDAGACAAPPVGGIDQRGVARPFDGDADGVPVCDIGAYESANRPPTVTVSSSTVVVDEGRTAVNSGSFSDLDGDDIALSASIGSVEAAGGTWSWSHLALDGPDSSVIRVEASDGSAGAFVEFDLTVRNVPPDVVAPPSVAITSGDMVVIAADFSDPSPLDTFTATIDFGLGAGPEVGRYALLGSGRGRVEDHRRYFLPGSFVVTICVTDDDGGRGCDTMTVEVRPIPVAIDIKPGGVPNSINLLNRGVIPVAVLSSATFDASAALPLATCFGDAESATQRDCSEAHGRGHVEDVNRDGLPDLVLHFETLETGIDSGDIEACLTGELPDGRVFAGCDSIRVVSVTATGFAEGRAPRAPIRRDDATPAG